MIEQISLGGEALLIFSWEERISREISFFGISEFAVFFDSEFRLEFRHFPWFGPKQDFPPFFQHVLVGGEESIGMTDSDRFHFNSFLDRS